ncbi:heme exporter protein CcmD [Pseudolysobacter antarcticus]|uniref:Heme exporter protein D n=1 Tax=Pseudolysobacter antarcticus TaxID=2511995 RepID=A0A411HL45_9GAMM|nr:heme exporter protein CcmD [Pseudolysobacter antarcticus]QBB71134.1 heme exporter protein CcmD [Pseudolysobacter antarcticus]
MSDVLAMGGYGNYVWISYALFVFVLLLDALVPLLYRRQLLIRLRGQFRRQQARRNTP